MVLYILTPKTIFHFPANNLEESWIIAINLAVENGFIFGKDFVFTFGPLGYLWTGLPIFGAQVPIIIFQIFLLICLVFILSYYLKHIKTRTSKAFFFLFILVTPIILQYEKAVFLLLLFLFFVFHHLRERKRFAVFVVGGISILAFFMKMNTGLILTVLLIPYLVFLNVLKIEKVRFTLIYMLVYLLIIYVFSVILRVSLFSYIINSIDLINYYNDAMIIKPPLKVLILTGVIMFLFLAVFLVNLRHILKDKISLFVAFYVAMGLYLVFKQSFVRADGHMLAFVGYNTFLLSMLTIFIDNSLFKIWFTDVVVISGIISIILFKIIVPSIDFTAFMELKNSQVPYYDLFFTNPEKSAELNFLELKPQAEIPAEPLKKLKQGSVDIIPWDISYLYFNELKYNPRPVIQSYSAYSELLERLNAEKYVSSTAPDFVLYSFGSIDNRQPFWDESLTKLSLLTNYEVVDYFKIPANNTSPDGQKDFIMMGKRPVEMQISQTDSKTFLYKIGDTLQIRKSDNLVYLSADFKYTLWGKIRRFLFQPNRMAVEIFCENQSPPYYYDAILPLLKGGVPVNKKILTIEDAKIFFETKGKGNSDVKAIRFTPTSLGIKDQVKITLKEYEIN